MLVTKAMEKYYAFKAIADDTEWDTKALHASDLGFCVTKTWARRNGLAETFSDPDARRTMAFGKLMELEIAEALRFCGVEFIPQVEVKGNLFGVDIECHADFDFPTLDHMIEGKTKSFWQGWKKNPDTDKSEKYVKNPDDPKMYDFLQAACSAMLLGRETFGIPNIDRGKGAMVEFTYKTAKYGDRVKQAILERAETKPGDEKPDITQPLYDWECSTCAAAVCHKNKNPFLQEIR